MSATKRNPTGESGFCNTTIGVTSQNLERRASSDTLILKRVVRRVFLRKSRQLAGSSGLSQKGWFLRQSRKLPGERIG